MPPSAILTWSFMRCSAVLLLTVISSVGLAANLRGVSASSPWGFVAAAQTSGKEAQTDGAIAPAFRIAQTRQPTDPSSAPLPSPPELLGLGSRGAAVQELQTTLNRLGYYYGAINGEFGKETQTALLTFQKESGLVATGELDDPTRARLRQARVELLGDEAPLFGGEDVSAGGIGQDEAGVEPSELPVGESGEVAEVPQREPVPPEPESTESADWIGWAGLLAGLAIAIGVIYSQLRQSRLGTLETDSGPALDGAGGSGVGVPLEPPLNPGWSRAAAESAAPSNLATGHAATGHAATGNGDAPPQASPATSEVVTRATGVEPAPQPDPKPDMLWETVGPIAATSSSQALIPTPARSPQSVDSLAHAAPDSNPETSLETVLTETTRLQRISIVDKLLEELHSPDPATRRKAIWELGQAGDSRAVQPLVDLLVEADSQQCGLILATLSEIALRTLKPMKQALLTSLRDSNADVRKNAIRDVTRMYDVVTQMSDLLSHAVNDPDPEVQATARWAIAQLSRGRSRSDLNGSAGTQAD
ncbi:peptidoglycan-binding protein [Thermoleptolyngbya sp. C42_A2020_037]|uniref:HEAT repeat domain-containing protein n=1 Tax=Thermoleptolyngbya sp. C42_A2020_037 TaxID=2747799 RepID=UPI0019FBAADD|nr:peptidoglycan-binding protein [Thermoleptolyngbya sp. C42_A2020_037]MBF2084709.1 peptidoglycan-binding protein [Thermoleptolyngbya sp. C42_A2020_037]